MIAGAGRRLYKAIKRAGQDRQKGESGLTQEEKQRVTQWLYSIRKREFALDKLKETLEILESKKETPPKYTSNFEAVVVFSNDVHSKQEAWTEFLDSFDARKSFLLEAIERHTTIITCYYDTLELLKQDEEWGYFGERIIRHKYYNKVKPDKVIYIKHLGCTERTYYRIHGKALRFFQEALPNIFRPKTSGSIVAVNS